MATISPAKQANVSSNQTPIYVLFDAETVDGAAALTRDHLVRLAAGTVGAVRIRNFGSPQECASVLHGLDTCPMGSYDEEIVVPRIPKLGPAAYDHYDAHGLGEAYWRDAEESEHHRSTLLDGADPLDLAVDRIRRAWGGGMTPATCRGRAMYAGMIRETTGGMKMHWDEIARELPGALDEPVIAQLGFNWYLSMPEGGGATKIFRRRWLPGDEQWRDGYGYAEEIAEHEPSVLVRPEAGDAVLFDPRNFHAVRGNEGPGRRVAISFFMGVTASGSLVYWS
ncbi:proline hydroxylase [Streptomyces kaniharaensis]|uniref:Proline hydroxylase n=1 Tax=Streptomyces kaniharaensis TaxID=212423 RepID=A0A6N7KWE3_9ACTN|nr:putative 2OG-Fe(II) oxygenase [Streptomyces kaniharaensis]MQS14929.1 proline hydroxylase [Streptomyces kaniharaensis]